MTEKLINLGTPEQFARVRFFLQEVGFDQANVCQTFDFREISDFAKVDSAAVDLADVSESLALCMRIFLFETFVPGTEIRRFIDPPTLESFLALGLLRSGDFHSGEFYAPVLLYPINDLLIVSDRFTDPGGSLFAPPADLVFPAFHQSTTFFLRLISKSPASDALDLGSGSGIAALALSRYVEHVVASDITFRATHFADFNRLLNRCNNVEVVRGNLYDPVENQTFDRIVSHVPYIPTVEKNFIFSDGGITGEKLIRRVVEGLPVYLRPGGTFYGVCTGLDTREGQFEERVRKWLGPDQDDFDVTLAAASVRSPEQFIADLSSKQSTPLSETEQLRKGFENFGLLRQIGGALVVHRRRTPGSKPLTQRVKLALNGSREPDPDQQEWNAEEVSLDELSGAW